MADKNQRSSSERGFAAMDPAKQREIARKGGESVPAAKRSFSQDHALAAQAGRKGGQSVAAEDRSFSRNRELAAEAGRKGGQESGGGRGAKAHRTPQQTDRHERPEEHEGRDEEEKDRAEEDR
jgi:general stress protein YciG